MMTKFVMLATAMVMMIAGNQVMAQEAPAGTSAAPTIAQPSNTNLPAPQPAMEQPMSNESEGQSTTAPVSKKKASKKHAGKKKSSKKHKKHKKGSKKRRHHAA